MFYFHKQYCPCCQFSLPSPSLSCVFCCLNFHFLQGRRPTEHMFTHCCPGEQRGRGDLSLIHMRMARWPSPSSPVWMNSSAQGSHCSPADELLEASCPWPEALSTLLEIPGILQSTEEALPGGCWQGDSPGCAVRSPTSQLLALHPCALRPWPQPFSVNTEVSKSRLP